MTAVPLGMLVLFVVWMSGGPGPSMRWLEGMLEAIVAWGRSLVR
jgi:hypothetical protein